MIHNISPSNIQSLMLNEIFVYGANQAWIHGAGAARQALKWGAIYGQGPAVGRTYGICTKDKNLKTLGLDNIYKEVKAFERYASALTRTSFLVTEIGCGLAGYQPKDIAPMFWDCSRLPNVYLPISFWRLYDEIS